MRKGNLSHEPCHVKTCLLPYANKKDADQPAYHCLDNMICVLAICKVLKILACFCSWAGWFESYQVENPLRHVFPCCGSYGLWLTNGTVQHSAISWLIRILKVLKVTIFHCHSKRVHSCVMHRSISYLLNLQLFWAKISWILPWQPYLRHPIFIKCWSCHRNKIPWQQNSFILKGYSAIRIKETYSYLYIWDMTLYWPTVFFIIWTASAQSRQNRRCSLIQAVNQEEPSNRKPDPRPLWMAGHAQLKFVMTECSKTQIRLTGLI